MNALVRILGAVVVWSVGVASAVVPIPFGGSLIALGLSVGLWLGLGWVSVVLLRPLGRRAGSAAAWLTLVLALVLLNWVSVSPSAWFYLHRPAYSAAASSVTGNATSYYGSDLPLHLRWLTVDGRVVAKDGALFFPQWYGIPDDGGGFFYSPGGSPVGTDMAGMMCRNPQSLGSGWWACGMSG